MRKFEKDSTKRLKSLSIYSESFLVALKLPRYTLAAISVAFLYYITPSLAISNIHYISNKDDRQKSVAPYR